MQHMDSAERSSNLFGGGRAAQAFHVVRTLLVVRAYRVALAVAVALSAGLAQGASGDRPTKAGRAGNHGALAYESASGAFGYSFDFPTSRQAKQAALAQCANPKCLVMVNIKNACAAIVQGPKRPFSSQGATRDEAETRAMNRCGDEAKCKPVGWVCTK